MMLNSIFTGTGTTAGINLTQFLACTAVSLILGAVCALIYMYKNQYHKSFVVTLTLLPLMVQLVIMLVNGNVGAGVAVMGAFSLVRFRSIPGTAKDIGSIFCAMAVGLATGMGFLTVAAVFVAAVGLMSFILMKTSFGENRRAEKELHITIPEDLDYTGIFDELFAQYTDSHQLIQVKTTNMGSLFELTYKMRLKNPQKEKEFIDQLRCRNGNLKISCGLFGAGREVI